MHFAFSNVFLVSCLRFHVQYTLLMLFGILREKHLVRFLDQAITSQHRELCIPTLDICQTLEYIAALFFQVVHRHCVCDHGTKALQRNTRKGSKVQARSVVVVLGLFMSIVAGCGASGLDDSDTSHPFLDVAPLSTSGLPVYFAVLTRPDGTGNEYFSEGYARSVLVQANELSGHVVQITFAGLVRVPDEDYDNPLQGSAFNRYRRGWPVAGFVVVVVSNPYTVDGDGMAAQAGLNQNTAPFFTLHTRNLRRESCGCDGSFGVYAPVGSMGDLREMAAMWLHELGHNEGLMHEGTYNLFLPQLTAGLSHPFPEGDDLNTDNYYSIAQDFLALFARKLEGVRAGAGD